MVRIGAFFCVALVLGCGPEKGEDAGILPFDAGFNVDAAGFDAGDPNACTARTPGDPGIVLGSGEVEWQEVTDGDTVGFVRGPQGGYHFYGSIKQRNIDTSSNSIIAFATFEGDEQINDGLGVYARPAEWVRVGDGWRARVGLYVIMHMGPGYERDGPEDMEGHTICVVGRVTDASGVEYMDKRTVSLHFEGDMM